MLNYTTWITRKSQRNVVSFFCCQVEVIWIKYNSAWFQQSLRLDPDDRPTCTQLLKHEFFQKDGFITRIQHDLKQKVHRETHNNPLIKTSSSEKEDGDDPKGSNIKKKKKINDIKDNKVFTQIWILNVYR